MSEPTRINEQSRSAPTAVRELVRSARKGALATLDVPGAGPYVSLVTLATDPAGAPLMLLSTLARHTMNLNADPRASLLIDASGETGDPLQGCRVTLIGRVAATRDPAVRRRFLARHDAARFYADFADFSFYRLEVESAHYVGGFGRIIDLERADVLTDVTRASSLIDAEEDIIAHMNADHADAVALYAGAVTGQHAAGTWRMTGIDPEGCDLAGYQGCVRLTFPAPIATPADARRVLAELAAKARKSHPHDLVSR